MASMNGKIETESLLVGQINGWVEALSNANKKLGITTILLFFAIGLYVGLIPSPLTEAHQELDRKVSQNQVMILTVLSFRNADCLNKAEAEAMENQALFNKFRGRCADANNNLNQWLKTIGVQEIALEGNK